MCAKLNILTSGSVTLFTKFITKVIHWMSFIIVLNFMKFCSIISEMGIMLPFINCGYRWRSDL